MRNLLKITIELLWIIVVPILDILLPLRKQAVVTGYPEGDISIQNLIHALQQSGYRIVQLSNRHFVESDNSEIKRVSKKRFFQSLYYYLTSELIFSTHGVYESLRPRKSQKKVNIWHGMPVKDISPNKPHFRNASYLLNDKCELTEYFSKKFNIPLHRILSMQNPRLLGITRQPSNKIYWLPTYRQYSEERSFEDLFRIDLNDLDDFLVEKGLKLIIGLHPLERKINFKNTKFKSISLKGTEENADINDLANAALLITDISSIAYDLRQFGVPSQYYFPDRVQYEERNAVLWQYWPEIEANLISTQEDLKLAISKISLEREEFRSEPNNQFDLNKLLELVNE